MSLALLHHAGDPPYGTKADTVYRPDSSASVLASALGAPDASPGNGELSAAGPGLRLSFNDDEFDAPAADASEGLELDHVALRAPSLEPAIVEPDTVHRGTSRPRIKAVTYSSMYATRLTIHRIGSYATIPLFIGQYITGSQLLAHSNQAPPWALHMHGPIATAVTTLFTVNTVTGLWNMWEARMDCSQRFARTVHGLLFMVADAGFAYTGYLSGKARTSDSIRHFHKQIALESMAVSLVAYAIELPPFRK
jgi:hypothetical protein